METSTFETASLTSGEAEVELEAKDGGETAAAAAAAAADEGREVAEAVTEEARE